MIGDDREVSQLVTDVVVSIGWLWVFAILYTIPVGAWVLLYNLYRTGTVPDLSPLTGAVNPGFVVLGVAGGIAVFVLMLANTTFGESNVEAAIDQGQDLRDEADEVSE